LKVPGCQSSGWNAQYSQLISLIAHEQLGGARGALQKCMDDETALLGKDEQHCHPTNWAK